MNTELIRLLSARCSDVLGQQRASGSRIDGDSGLLSDSEVIAESRKAMLGVVDEDRSPTGLLSAIRHAPTQFWLVVAGIFAILLPAALYFFRSAKAKGRASFLLVGPVGSGKTAIFSKVSVSLRVRMQLADATQYSSSSVTP